MTKIERLNDGQQTVEQMCRCPFLVSCTPRGAFWHVLMRPYSGRVPREVWEYLNTAIPKRAAQGLLMPADPMDVYQVAAIQLDKVANQKLDLHSKDLIAYLKGVINIVLKDYFTKKILPEQLKNRALENLARAIKIAGEVKELSLMEQIPDRDDSLGFPYDITLQEFVDGMPDFSYSKRRDFVAKAFVQKMYACLEEQATINHNATATEAVRLFKLFIACHGNKRLMENVACLSHGTFIRKWNHSVELARNTCANIRL